MPKYAIGEMPPPLSDDVRNALQRCDTATIGHKRNWGFLDPSITCILPKAKIVGVAVTLAIPAQDSTLLHHAMTLVRPGDVLVIDRLGDLRHACWGGVVTAAAKKAGLVGVIIDGMCTDPETIRELGFPVWSRGVSPITTRIQNIGGSLNQTVSCGGAAVKPGDAVLADGSGVWILPPSEVLELTEYAIAKQSKEGEVLRRIAAGEKLGHISGATALVESSKD